MPDSIHCRCTNISIPIPTTAAADGETHEVRRDQVTIRYPELTIWRDGPSVSRGLSSREREGGRRGSVSGGEKEKRKQEGMLVCVVCEEEMGKAVGDKIVWRRENPDLQPPDTHPTLLDLVFPSQPSTFGAPSRPTSPQQPQSYLPPLPDPFFLPPPFTPSHDFFHMIARQAASHAADVRARAEHDVAAFVARKRREVEDEEMAVRGQVEYLWKAFERGQREQGIDAREEARGRGPVSPNGARKTSFGAAVRPDLASQAGETSFGGAGSLLSASLSTHGFMAQRPRDPPNAASLAARVSPRQQSTHVKPNFEQNSITMPYQQRKSGIDLDVAASLRVSNMADLYSSPSGGASMHNRPDTRDRRYFDPGADVEDTDIRAERSPSLGKREKIERVGGQGDIELQPFAESSQVSAASSYQDSANSAGPREIGARNEEEDQLRTPRGRAVKPIGDSISPAQLSVPVRTTRTGSDASPATVKSLDKHPEPPVTGKRVTFEEPTVVRHEGVEPIDEDDGEDDGLDKQEDAVFDFEEHDTPIDPPEIGIASQPPVPLEGSTPDADKVEAMRRNTELVENKLIDMMAADAPSHRAAWRNNKDQLWQALGRTPSRPFSSGVARRAHSKDDVTEMTDGDDTPSWGTTMLGTSAPIQIQQPVKTTAKYALEPKTSLVEKPGVMVPALTSAMRTPSSGGSVVSARRGSSATRPPTNKLPADVVAQDAHNLPGSNSSSDNRRQASVGNAAGEKGDSATTGSSNPAYSLSDKRASFRMDPGPALEMDDDEDTDDGPGKVNFVPPHRQTSQDRDPDGMGEAGWRSLA